ncbi:MAG: DUF2490 domain-containing protein [Bacteroidia bacterium]
MSRNNCLWVRRLTSLLFTLFFFTGISAQTGSLGSWNIINIRFNYTNKLSFFGEAQLRSLRFYNHFHYYEYKAGAEYTVYPGLRIALGAGDYDTYREGGNFVTPKNNDEFRIWPQLQLSQKLGKIKIEQRLRAEFRFTSNGYRNRFRYRLGMAYAFGKERNNVVPYQISISNELFFTDREPYFERNRIAFNFNYKFSETVGCMAGYLHQFDYRINDETGRDFLQLGIYFEIDRKSEK